MAPLEQAAILLTLIKRLRQVMDHERTVLQRMKLDDLGEIQAEKKALAEAYEAELARLRTHPETLAALDAPIRKQLESAMRDFQEALAANRRALIAAQAVIERVVRNIADSLAQTQGSRGYGPPQRHAGHRRGEVIPVAFNRQL